MALVTYCYSIRSRYLGLRHQCCYCDFETGEPIWEGPWRWRHAKALEDMMDHSYDMLWEQMTDALNDEDDEVYEDDEDDESAEDDGLDLFRQAEDWDEDWDEVDEEE